MKYTLLMAGLFGLLALSAETRADTDLRILCWNVESEGTDPDIIAQQLSRLGPYHIFALSEVLRSDLRRYADAIGHATGVRYHFVHSGTGHDDRLEIVFDTTRLILLESRELFQYGDTLLNDPDWKHRSPLVAKFRDRLSQKDFLLVVNHLARGDAGLRTVQATGLRKWAETQVLPVVAVGDFNFDYVFATEQGNAAFQAFTQGDIWQWVRPKPLIDSNWSDRDEDGEDDYPGSILDFTFVGKGAKKWQPVSRVIVRQGDFPDDRRTSDHRPVELILKP